MFCNHQNSKNRVIVTLGQQNLVEEPLGFRGIGFSPMFVLLKPTFSLLLHPHLLARALPSKAECSPTDAF